MHKEMLFRSALLFLICLLAFSLSVFCVFGCSKKSEDKNKEVLKTPGDSYLLSAEDVEKLSIKGGAGDAEAAYRLWLYYEFYAGNYEKALYWEKRAAEGGHVNAQYGLGIRYLLDPRVKDKEQALYWLGKAAENGDLKAREKLGELKKQK